MIFMYVLEMATDRLGILAHIRKFDFSTILY